MQRAETAAGVQSFERADREQAADPQSVTVVAYLAFTYTTLMKPTLRNQAAVAARQLLTPDFIARSSTSRDVTQA